MAVQSSLDIRIRALVEGLEQLRGLADGLKGTASEAEKTGAASQSAGDGLSDLGNQAARGNKGVNDFRTQLKGLQEGTTELTDILKKAALAFASFLAIKGVKELADTAARTETLGVTLDVVGRNAGYSTEQLRQYEAELKKLGISTSAARESLTGMIQAGLSLNSVNERGVTLAAQLARASQDLAVVTGENSSETLRRLIVNIQQMDTVGLRFQGLTVNITAAQEKFAASIGKTADQLTQQQKVQAVANATLAEAAKLQGAYEKALDTVGKKLGSLSRYQEEAANSLGKSLLPAYGVLVDAATETLKEISKVADEVNRQGEVAEGLRATVEAVVGPLSELVSELVNLAAEVAPDFTRLAEVVGSMVGEVFSLVEAFVALVRETGALSLVLQTLGLLFAGVKDGVTVLVTALAGIGLVFLRIAEYAARGKAAVQDFFGFSEDAKLSQQAAEAFQKQADATQAAIEQNIRTFTEGRSAVQQYALSIAEGAKKQEEAAKNSSKAFKDMDGAITNLKSQIRDNKLTSLEAADAINKLEAEVKKAGATGALTKKEMAELSQRLRSMAGEDADKATKAIADLGLSMQSIGELKFLEGMDKKFGEVSTALQTLASNAAVSQEQFKQAFAAGIDTAPTVASIASLANILREAGKAGRDTKDEVAQLGDQFTKVFNEELKTANTQAEIDLLRQKVVALKDTYPELAAVAKQALAELEKASANGGKTALDTAKQALDVARQQTAVYKASLDVRRAETAVAEKVRAVDQARAAFAKEGTALNRLKVELAEAEVVLAQAELAAARTQAQVEQQNMTVLIAQQKALNAEKAAGQGKISQAEADAIKQKAEDQEVILNQKLQEAETQEQNVEKQREQVDELKGAVAAQEQLNAAKDRQSDSDSKGNANLKEYEQTFTSLLPTAAAMQAELEAIGVATDQAANSARNWYNSIGQGGAGSSFEQVWEGIRLMENNLKMAKESTAALNAQTQALVEKFNQAKAEAAGVDDAVRGILPGMTGGTEAARQYAAAVSQIKNEARQVSQAAVDATRSFESGARSISQELLSLQGREEEAIRSKIEARKQELAVQYEMLKVQLNIAIATAKAAGVDTNELEEALSNAKASYRQAQEDLTKIERLELQKRAAQKEEDRQAQLKADADALAQRQQEQLAATEAAKTKNEELAKVAGLVVTQAASVSPAAAPPQSIAQQVSTATTAPKVEKVIRLDLTADGKSVSATLAEAEEQTLLQILERSRKVT